MKTKQLFALKLVLIFLMLSSTLYANNLSAKQEKLDSALENISNKFQILFTYDIEYISNYEVNNKYNNSKTPKDALNTVLDNTPFEFKFLGGKYYVIYSNDEKGKQRAEELAKDVNTYLLDMNKQEAVITGKVTDTYGNPIFGANIIVKNTSIGTTTDIDGNYKLTIENTSNITIVVSYLGYKTTEFSINSNESNAVKNIILEEGVATLGEVMITARKKNERAQDVPMSITTIGQKSLTLTNSVEVEDVAIRIPNVSFGPGGGGGVGDGLFSTQISIRGINGQNTTGFYLDELPLPENVSPRLIDVNRVEVLKGPQGTLYGSASMGGAVKVITNKPNVYKFDANVNTSYATQEEGDAVYGVDAMVNIPIKEEKSAFRLAAFYNERGGVFDRVVTGTLGVDVFSPASLGTSKENVDSQTVYGAHASIGWNLTDNITLTPKIIYQRTEGGGYPFADASVDNFTQSRGVGLEEDYESDFIQYSLTGEFDLKGGKVTSATSFVNWDYIENEDATEFISATFKLAPAFFASPISRSVDYSRFVEELRYSSDWEESKFSLIGGLFYSSESYKPKYNAVSTGLGEFFNAVTMSTNFTGFDNIFIQNGYTDTKEFALFGEFTYAFSDKFSATVGLRYFNSNQERFRSTHGVVVGNFDPSNPTIQNGELKESGVNPKITLDYKITKNNLIYATVSKGFRLGGVNEDVPEVFCGDELAALGIGSTSTFDSDFLWNYEIGSKNSWFDGRFILNASVFHIKWSEIQQQRTLTCGFPFIGNVGAAESTGFEVDTEIKTSKSFSLGGSFGFVDAVVTESDATLEAEVGDQIQQSPRTSSNIFAIYKTDLFGSNPFYIRGDYQNRGRSFTSFEGPSNAARTLDAFDLLNFKTGIELGNWNVSLFIDNVTNKQVNYGDVISLAAEAPGRPRYATNRPRTMGINLGWKL